MQSITNVPPAGIRTQSYPKCILCGSEGSELYSDLSDPFFGAPGLWRFKRCPRENCGLIWLDPTPIDADLHLAYQKYFTHGSQDAKPTFGGRVREILYRLYHIAQYPAAALTGLRASKRRMEQMHLHEVKPGKVLDVGCGDGAFLNRMRNHGWTVEGVDFDEKAVRNGKIKYGLDLRHGDLAGAHFPDDGFDAITMSHVIEHVRDPIALLGEARRILKPGGRLVVTTPNSESFGHEHFKGYWFGIDAPRHLHVFGVKALRECALRAGMEVIWAGSTAANADIFIGGSFSIRDSAGHRTDAHPRPNVLRILKTIYLQYWEHVKIGARPDCGEEAVLICRKKAA